MIFFFHRWNMVRDKAHASRRILQRPWACDPYLELVAGVLVSETNSVAQMIQHSDDLRAWFEECCKNATRKGTTAEFKHLRAAKHCYESLSSLGGSHQFPAEVEHWAAIDCSWSPSWDNRPRDDAASRSSCRRHWWSYDSDSLLWFGRPRLCQDLSQCEQVPIRV